MANVFEIILFKGDRLKKFHRVKKTYPPVTDRLVFLVSKGVELDSRMNSKWYS
jgi:hypothetical protein